ncbi:testis-expressed protein 36 isoform X2 [Cygnus atratus]|uniref:testis-expressed protein 36 isoform X2 n=1 Tax=Cygnus atratus TaxID=8868 RepID=UPI0021B71E8B|nr:testis-expressed protein 36 isoform X2 [Cygnus atratus]
MFLSILVIHIFAHVGECQSQPESTTSSALKQAQDAHLAQHMEGRLPLTYRAREQGMGRRKVEPERRQQNSQNFFLWAHESVPSSEDGLTIYQTSFVKDQNTESPFCRRYPKHHTEESRTDKSAPENGKNMQPNKSS